MVAINWRYNKLPAQKMLHDDDTTDILAFLGGLGCLKEDSLVLTASGEVPICDIDQKSLVLSYHDKSNRFVYQSGSDAFPKGKDYLYRVVSEHGEFLATEHHPLFSSDYTYKYLKDLCVGHEIFSISDNRHEKNLSQSQKLFRSGVLGSWNKLLGLINHYVECIRQRDPQLLEVLNIFQDDLPLPFCVQESSQMICSYGIVQKDDLEDKILKHIRPDQSFYHSEMMDCIFQMEDLALGEGGQILTTSFERTLLGILQRLRSLDFYEYHPRALLFYLCRILACVSSSTSNATNYKLEKTKILSIEKQGKKDWVWDMKVPNTNNYVANGHIHHNSGKSYGLMMKLLKLSWLNKGYAGGLLSPSVEDFKKDMLPLFEECFENHGLQDLCKYHRQDKCFKFPWTNKPLYVFSGEKPIAGPNLAYCGINEPSLIKEVRVNEMLRRVRVKNAPVLQRVMAGTPEDVHGWLQDFVEQHSKSGKLRIIQGSTRDNRHIDEGYYNHLMETLDPTALRVFAEGELIFLGSNLFYYAFEREKNLTDIEINVNQRLYLNVDFNVGHMTCTAAQLYQNSAGKKTTVFCDEIVLKDKAADTYAMVNAIKEKYYQFAGRIMITCDFSGKARKTTGPSDVNVLRQNFGDDAVRYRASGNIRMRKRQLLVNGLLHSSQILINKQKCPKLYKDIMKVQQKEDFSKDKKNEDLTHSSDTMDYLIDQEYEFNDRQRYTNYRAM